ncbi:MAG TPA: hypothetical protein VF223_26270 [Trebonia sp.]
MSAGGFTGEGLAALDAALAGHTSSSAVPGLVAPAVARDFWSAAYAALA